MNTIPGLVPDDTSLYAQGLNDAALKKWRSAPTTEVRFSPVTPGGSVYTFGSDMDFTCGREFALVVEEGAALQQGRIATTQNSSAYGISVAGSFTGVVAALAADSPRFASSVDVGAGASSFTVGDVVHLLTDGDSWLVTGKYNPAALRTVVAIEGTKLALDAPLFRAFTVAGRARVCTVDLHPAVHVSGGGTMRQLDPVGQPVFWNPLARFELCRGVTWDGLDVGFGGGAGVEYASCLDVKHTGTVHDLQDAFPNNVGGLGYGILISGATTLWDVNVSGTRVRHLVTTGAWAGSCAAGARTVRLNAAKAGDPELGHFGVRVLGSTSQGVDTHEAGHHIDIDALILGGNTRGTSGGDCAVNIRTDATTVTAKVAAASLSREAGAPPAQESALVHVDFTTSADPTTSATVRVEGYGGGFGVVAAPGPGQVRIERSRLVGTGVGVRCSTGDAGSRVLIDGLEYEAAGRTRTIGFMTTDDFAGRLAGKGYAPRGVAVDRLGTVRSGQVYVERSDGASAVV